MLMMKILQVVPALNQGGVERGTVDEVAGLVAAGCQAYVMSSGGSLVSAISELGGQHIEMRIDRKSIRSFAIIPHYIRCINQLKPDIIHLRSRVPAWIHHFAKPWLDPSIKTVTTYHGLYHVSPYSRIMTRADKVVAVSKTVKTHMMQHYQVPASRICLIPRGCDPNTFVNETPSQTWLNEWYETYPETQGKKLLTLVARLTKTKGIEYFLRLLAKLGPDTHGLLVGSLARCKPHFHKQLVELIKSLGLTERITWCDHRRDVAKIYAISNVVFNLGTQPESFGRTTIEAIQTGTPVVGWNWGGVGEVLGEIFPDGLVTYKDEQALLMQTNAILLGQYAPPKQNPFTHEQYMQLTLNMYQQLLKEKVV